MQKAARYYEQALDILREVNDFFGEGQTLLNISLLYSEMHRNDVVLASLLLARELFRNVQSLDYDRAQRQIETLREEIGERSFAALLRSVESQELQLVEQALLMDT